MTLGLEALSNEIFGKNHLCSSIMMITNICEKFDSGEESKNKTLIDFWWPSKFSWNKLSFLNKWLPCFSLPYSILYDLIRKVLNFIRLKTSFVPKQILFSAHLHHQFGPVVATNELVPETYVSALRTLGNLCLRW